MLSLDGQNLTANGTFTNNGTLRRTGLETVALTQDTSSGVWQYVGNNDGSSDLITIQDFGGTDYVTLTIDDTAPTQDTYNLGSGLHVANLMITNGLLSTNSNVLDVDQNLDVVDSLDAGALNVFVGGNLTINGSFNAGTSTVTLDGTNQALTTAGVQTFYNLVKQDTTNNATSRTPFPSSTTITIGNSLNLDGLDANDRRARGEHTGHRIDLQLYGCLDLYRRLPRHHRQPRHRQLERADRTNQPGKLNPGHQYVQLVWYPGRRDGLHRRGHH
ncbi:MAG: hypothetical protein U0514_00070 [Candidatus Andersenbacteria bacterium]